MDKFDQLFEQFKVHGKDLAAKTKDLIHEGNVRRIIVKDEHGNTFMEIPLTVATLGVVAAPVLAAVGAVAGMAAKFTVEVERDPRATPSTAPPAGNTGPSDPSMGATEDQVDMAGTAAQHMDSHGTRAEDVAGTGEPDAQGG